MLTLSGEKNLKNADIERICRVISSITKLDVRLLDGSCVPVLQLVSHSIPAAMSCGGDWEQICSALKKGSPSSYCYHTNASRLEFVACGIWPDGDFAGFMVAGPFLSGIPDSDFISEVIYKCGMPISERQPLKEFYESLTVAGMSYSGDIAALMVNLCSRQFIVPRLEAEAAKPALSPGRYIRTDAEETRNIINTRYAFEKDMMNAIAKGDKERAEQLMDENDVLMSFPERAESTIRSLKNISFVLNTLCRIAAERGGVQPVYLHNISEKFAIMIERAPNLPYLKELSHIMIDEYCSLVRTTSGMNYSTAVKKAADYIDLNIEKQLTVKDIAGHVHVNASHLSRKFKSETGMTMVDYINRRRVEESKLFLETGSASITEVALMVGYNDLNYFGRVFRKVTGISPSEYVKSRSSSDLSKEVVQR